jgi:hypothetical protein
METSPLLRHICRPRRYWPYRRYHRINGLQGAGCAKVWAGDHDDYDCECVGVGYYGVVDGQVLFCE